MTSKKKPAASKKSARKTNKFGLSRTIPEPVARAVRQQCGFGCVVCGNAVFEYEHFEPEFVDAKAHEAVGMTLLCPTCHSRKTRGRLSRETIASCIADPFCLRKGFASEVFDVGAQHPRITLGNIETFNVDTILEIDGERVLWIEEPEEPNTPYRINAHFKNRGGTTLFKIENNEWQAPSDSWDVQTVGRSITIRKQAREIVLDIRIDPPHGLHIERLTCDHRGWSIHADTNRAVTFTPRRGASLTTAGMGFENMACAVSLRHGAITMGISNGKGTARVHVRDMLVLPEQNVAKEKR